MPSGHAAVLCGSEAELHPTADFGYVRLREPSYTEEQLATWIDAIREKPWKEAFVFFKHDEDAAGPEGALALARLLESRQ